MNLKIGIDLGSDTIKAAVINGGGKDEIERIEPIKITGKPIARLRDLLIRLKNKSGNSSNKISIALTGSGASRVCEALGIEALPEIDALAASIRAIYDDVEHVIEIGAETQKYLSFFHDKNTGEKLLEDVIPGGKCAGGTGSFIDYMHKRLKYKSIEDFIETGLKVQDPASISGRCAVFAESDIVHHYQKGTSRDRIVAGIHQAVARSFKSLIRKGAVPRKKIALVGGVAQNKCILRHLANELQLDDNQFVVPEEAQHMSAIGAAILADNPVDLDNVITRLENWLSTPFEYEHTSPLNLEKSVIMTQGEDDEEIKNTTVELASLGLDIGSVSTKAALITRIDGEYKVLASYYRRTEGNPIEAVKDVLNHISRQIKEKNIDIKKLVAATTGSGRYLTGYFIGANQIKDEITSQAAGVSTFIREKDLTVLEIGGQDSKFLKLRDGTIFDFEMNWACAAGTGALIEKHAKNLNIPITEFGAYALRGDKPPIINSTCAVFSEAALMYFQQNNVSLENLCAGACLASARNYVIKVVRNRSIGEKVAFQGAVAFNQGMVAAFETILERPIIVPPYPHLTGAIGCARIAYEEDETNPVDKKFRGFETIARSEYKLSNFTCKKCGNECSVNVFKVGDETFYQGDRCDRYSGQYKKNLGEHLPDLFREREQMLMNTFTGEPKADSATVGIPRGLLFNDYYPFFNTFFRHLGFNVKPSPPTSKKIIRKGIESVVAEPCFPIKVAHGHAKELLDQGVDYLFIPAIMRSDQKFGDYDLAVTCPYLQTAPDVIKAALEIDKYDTKLISPVLFLDRGFKHLRRKMIGVAEQLGVKASKAKKALEEAQKTLAQFREKVISRGREILKNLSPDEIAFVIIGRPYSLHDPGINMNVAKKVRDEGYLAIPFDMLPLSDPDNDPSDTWTNIYPVQGQKKVAAARFIKNKPNLHALVITYFGCGPDAFIDEMFYKELNRQYLTIQIDEHTSDTGILTRIQAHLSSARNDTYLPEEQPVNTTTTPITRLRGKKRLWLPNMNESATLLAAAMRAYGIDARVLPVSKDSSLALARNRISGDVCIPMLYTTQDMLERAASDDFDPEKEAFFQGQSGGPCRYGMYFMLEKILLEELAGKPVDMVTLGNKDSDGGLGNSFLILCWDALVAHDLLQKMLFHTRPYEINPGDSDKIFEKYISKMETLIEDPANKPDNILQLAGVFTGGILNELSQILTDARKEFENVPVDRTPKPLVGAVGEFFVRQHEPSNFSLVRTLEKMGCEVWLAPGTEFLGYSNYITGVHAEDYWKDNRNLEAYKEVKLRKLLHKLGRGREHKLFKAVKPYVGHMEDISPDEVVELGDQYVTLFFGGEAILSLGKAEDFARRNLDGIVAMGPFNCMPSMVVSALSRELRKKYNKIPFLNIDFDGFDDNTRQARISAFVSQVKDRMRARKKTS